MSRSIQKTVCHDLKILPEYFLPVLTGKKTFEIRYNDRNFHTGDLVRLREWSNGEYTGNYVVKQITYILRDELYGLYCHKSGDECDKELSGNRQHL